MGVSTIEATRCSRAVLLCVARFNVMTDGLQRCRSWTKPQTRVQTAIAIAMTGSGPSRGFIRHCQCLPCEVSRGP
jgi:hypothetical protein